MPHRAERLEDGAVEDVGADRVRRLEAEDDHEDRRHQRAAAHAGQPDDRAEQQPGERELPGHDAERTMPAPTVSFVASSSRMNAPVARFSRVRVDAERLGEPEPDDADVVQLEPLRRGSVGERVDVDDRDELLDDGAHGPGRVLDGELRARLERTLAHPADARLQLACDDRRRRRDRRACRRATTSTSSASRIVTDCGGTASSSGPSAVSTAATRERQPRREHDDLVAGAPDAARDLAGVAAVVVVLVRHRPDHPLHREAAQLRGSGRTRPRSTRGARAASARRTTASRRSRRRRCRRAAPTSGSPCRSGSPSASRSRPISSKRSCDQSTRSILFTATATCGIASMRDDVRVPPRLLDDAVAARRPG